MAFESLTLAEQRYELYGEAIQARMEHVRKARDTCEPCYSGKYEECEEWQRITGEVNSRFQAWLETVE